MSLSSFRLRPSLAPAIGRTRRSRYQIEGKALFTRMPGDTDAGLSEFVLGETVLAVELSKARRVVRQRKCSVRSVPSLPFSAPPVGRDPVLIFAPTVCRAGLRRLS